jgi:N-ethylmaleimide reductase
MTVDLFTPARLGGLTLQNRIVMAPMTRSRAIGNVPNALMATYYGQRAEAGLIITEGVSPAPEGLGYARIPGIFTDAQMEGWRDVTRAVKARGGHIFMQLLHTGRVGHAANLPPGARILAPSAVAAAGEMWTDQQGMQPMPVPEEMGPAEIEAAREAFARGARNAVAAGFDGIELHAANGYLLEQFLRPCSNRRTDGYGTDRNRFVLEVAEATAKAIGAERVGIRLSPHGVFNDIQPFEGMVEAYVRLAEDLGRLGLVYLHMVDHSAMGAPAVPDSTKDAMRKAFSGTFILSGGYDRTRAEADLSAGRGDLVAFGRPFLSNPDLVRRLRTGAALATPDPATFYTPGEAGYTDYPALA